MTIETCMGLVDAMLPNRIPEAVKLCLLGEVEGKVRVELLGQEPAEGVVLLAYNVAVDFIALNLNVCYSLNLCC